MTDMVPSDSSGTDVSERSRRSHDERLPGLAVSGIASIAAGAIHAGAIGIHAEHPPLARLFVLVAVFQLGYGLIALLRPSRAVALAGAVGNAVIVGGWIVTRISGISWIGGLEQAESPQFTDTVCAVLGAVSIATALAAVLVGKRSVPHVRLAIPALVVTALTIPAMIAGAGHVHAEGEHAHASAAAADGAAATGDESVPHGHDETSDTAGAVTNAADKSEHTEDDGHGHDTTAPGDSTAPADSTHPHTSDSHTTDVHTTGTTDTGTTDAADWPRPYDPAQPIDMSDVPGVTAEQLARAEAILASTNEVLPAKFAQPSDAEALGFRSIGDGRTGFEHFVNYGYIGDERFMDPEYPESLVYQVAADGTRTLASAMFIAQQMPVDSPEIVDYAGPLMQWHVHENLCWGLDENGAPKVVAVTDADGNCPPGSLNTGGGNPMVHVWVSPNVCGPFAALEGHGAGQVADDTEVRADQCHHDHGATTDDGEHAHDATSPKPYDPTQPIDLSGMDGVTPEQQARAENLIAVTLYRLPQFADPADAEAQGFRTIGDGATGYEHYINWSYINDDKTLDPDYPESLVYTPQPDGTKKLVSAMYMLPDGYTLDDVPDVGGPLTQWHIHNNLCFSNDPSETGQAFVIGLTSPDGTCSRGVKLNENPMLHVWIVPHTCGPFAALEGVGAGQIQEGEERLCDTAHGAH